MRPLWTAENAKAATGGNGAGGWQADGVSIDSRSVKPGDLFVALKGPSHDGHDHVADALAKGAAAAMVQRRASPRRRRCCASPTVRPDWKHWARQAASGFGDGLSR